MYNLSAVQTLVFTLYLSMILISQQENLLFHKTHHSSVKKKY